jgi:hypothetical protein
MERWEAHFVSHLPKSHGALLPSPHRAMLFENINRKFDRLPNGDSDLARIAMLR